MPYGVVYRITCLASGKCYHGQTINPKERWPHHLRANSHCRALRDAIAKHGRANFTFEVVATASSSEELNSLERQFVATSMVPVGYNLNEGGDSRRLSAETRQKISESNKIAQNREDVRARNSLGVQRAMARPEVKERHRASLKAALRQPEQRERMSRQMKEVHSRPELKQKRREALREAWGGLTPEEREARIAKQRAACSPEVRSKIGVASRRTWSDSDRRQRQGERVREAKSTPEAKAAMSSRMKEIHSRPGEKERRGAAISQAHNTTEGKKKLARRRRRNESEEVWRERVRKLDAAGD